MFTNGGAIIVLRELGHVHKGFRTVLFHKFSFAAAVDSDYAKPKATTSDLCGEMPKTPSRPGNNDKVTGLRLAAFEGCINRYARAEHRRCQFRGDTVWNSCRVVDGAHSVLLEGTSGRYNSPIPFHLGKAHRSQRGKALGIFVNL